MKGLPLGLWRVQWAGSEPAPPSWCQSTQCCPGGSLRRGMKVWPSSRGFSQKAPSPRTLRWMTRCCRSPWGIRSYTSWEGGWGRGGGVSTRTSSFHHTHTLPSGAAGNDGFQRPAPAEGGSLTLPSCARLVANTT